jgi:hypothetical protein
VGFLKINTWPDCVCVREREREASHKLGRHPTTEPHPQLYRERASSYTNILFFLSALGLNSGPHADWAAALLLEPLRQPPMQRHLQGTSKPLRLQEANLCLGTPPMWGTVLDV